MTCQHVTLPGGGGAIVCGPTRRCRCGRRVTLLCDWPMPDKASGTCDVGLCDRCTTSPEPGKDLCPSHAKLAVVAPICPYCDRPSVLISKAVLYPQRPDLADLWVWRCEPCGAWVGCHPGTTKALGRLADKALRDAKIKAHAAFDPLWRRKIERDGCSKSAARKAAYKWLAGQLGIDREVCHIGMFDVATCARVVEICAPYQARR